MSNFNHIDKRTIVVSSGKGTLDTAENLDGSLKHIIIKAPSDSDTFNFKMADSDGFNIYVRDSIDGELNDLIDMPVKGQYEMMVFGATSDGNYTAYLAIREL